MADAGVGAQEDDGSWGFKLEGDGDASIGNSSGDLIQVTGSLDVNGNIYATQYIYHGGDTDTYFAFSGQNQINLVANGHSFLKYDGAIKINNANRDRNTQIMSDDGTVMLHVDAGDNRVGIGTTSPSVDLDVDGTVNATTYQIGGTAISSTAAEINKLDESTVSEASDGAWAVVERVAKATIDGDDYAVGLNTLEVTIPDNSIVTKVIIDCTTTFVGGAPESMITLGLYDGNTSLNQLVEMHTIFDTGAEQAPYEAGLTDMSSTLAAFKLTDDGELKLNVEMAALTAGIADIYIYYIIGA